MPPPLEGGNELESRITAQGDQVRALKSKKADKAEIDAAVKTLLDLKVRVVFFLKLVFIHILTHVITLFLPFVIQNNGFKRSLLTQSSLVWLFFSYNSAIYMFWC